MLGGLLGGLANLGTAYGGYLGAQNLYNRNQLQQLQLQDLLANQDLATFAIKNPQVFGQQPQPGTTAPSFPSVGAGMGGPAPLQPLTPTNLLPGSYSQPSAPAAPTPLPSLNAMAQFQAPIPGLDALGGGTSIGGMGGATLAGSPFGPGQPLTGPAQTGMGLPLGRLVTGLPSLQRELAGQPELGLGRDLPLADVPGAAAPEQRQVSYGGLGPPSDQSTVNVGALSLGQPTLDGFGIGGAAMPQPRRPSAAPPLRDPTAALAFTPQPALPDTGLGQRPDIADTRYAPGGTAAVPGTADRGVPAQLPADDTRAQIAAGQGGYRQIIQIESGGNMNIGGPGPYGEVGPAQITPDTWKQYSRPGEDIWNPQTNLAVGQRVYDDLLNKSGGDYAATLVGYNRGEGAMRRFQQAGDNLDALRGTRMMPTAAYQRAIRQAGGRGGGDSAEVVNMHAEMGGNLSREQHGIGDRGLQMILARMPQIPQAVQMMKPSELAQLIQQSFPGTSDAVKGAVFLKALPLMNDIAKEQTAQAWQGWKAQMEQLGFIQKEEDIAEQRAERRSEFGIRMAETAAYHEATAGKGGQVWQDPQSGQSYWVVGGRVQPLEGLPSTAARPSAARQGYQILTDPNTGTQFQQIPGRPETAIDMQGNPYKPTGAARLGALGAGQARWSEDAMNSLVQQALAGDPSVMQRLPRSGPARQQFEETLAAHMNNLPGGIEGNTSTMMMNRIRMIEAQSAARTAGRVTMNTELFSQEAQLAGKNLIEVSKEVPRTAFKPINELLLAFETNTGDPNVIKLGTAVNAVINAYGKMSNPTGTGIHDADKARISTVLDRSLAQGQIEAGVNQIITEGRLVSQAAQKAQEDVIGRLTPRAPESATPRSEETPSPATRGAAPEKTTGGTPDTAIATMNKAQVIARLQADPPPSDDERYQLNQRLNQLEAAARAAPPSTATPPIAR